MRAAIRAQEWLKQPSQEILHYNERGRNLYFSFSPIREWVCEDAERSISCSFSRSNDSRKQKIASCSYVRERIKMNFTLFLLKNS